MIRQGITIGRACTGALVLLFALSGCESNPRQQAAQGQRGAGNETTQQQASPYERAAHKHAEAEQEAARARAESEREAARWKRDRAVLSADVLEEAHRLIREANEDSGHLDERVFLQVHEQDRMMAFIPIEDAAKLRSAEELRESAAHLPARAPLDAILEQWTDRFVMAHQARHYFSNPVVIKVEESDVAPYLTGEVHVTVQLGRRAFQVNDLQLLPNAPNGLAAWRDAPWRFGNRRGGRRNRRNDGKLPRALLPGKLVDNTDLLGPFGRSAVEGITTQEWEELTLTGYLRVEYDPTSGEWKLVEASLVVPPTAKLRMPFHESRTDADYIFRPGEHGTPKSK